MVAIAAVDAPAKPNSPQVNYDLSSSTALYIHWDRVTDQVGPGGLITGYTLYMDDGYGGRFTEIFSTVGVSSLVTEYLKTGLTLSLTYRFKVIAHNYNSLSPSAESEIALIPLCTKPSQFARPTKLSTSMTSIAINWNEPGYNGGCAITGYAVMVDDGASGSYIEANVDNDLAVRQRPSLSTLLITRLQLANLGQTFRLKVRAFNLAGETESPIIGVILASLPLAPPVPVFVADQSNHQRITINLSDFNESTTGGGCAV